MEPRQSAGDNKELSDEAVEESSQIPALIPDEQSAGKNTRSAGKDESRTRKTSRYKQSKTAWKLKEKCWADDSLTDSLHCDWAAGWLI